MDIREKLVELLEQCSCPYSPPCTGECYECNNVEMYDKEIAKIADHLIANGVTVQEWISVKDRLPSDEKPVLAYYGYNNDGDYGLAMMFTGTLSYFCFDPNPHWQHEIAGLTVTHWMPLPTPPKGE